MRQSILCAATVATLTSAALAHDTWLVAGKHAPRPDDPLVLHVTTGTAFPHFGTAPDAARVARAEWRAGTRTGTITSFEKEESTLVARGRAPGEGVAVAWVVFQPKSIDLEGKDVEHYFDEIGATESVRRAWANAGEGAKFHETYTKHAKTFLRVGDRPADRSCLEPVGLRIEFLPREDPTMLAAGDTLAVKVMKMGDELEGLAVGAVCGADGSSTVQRTNQTGYVRFVIHRGGWWLLRATELRRNADGTWESDFTTMTFYAGGKK